METQIIKIGDKEYLAHVARTPEEKEKGLQGVTALEKDENGREEGMLFVYDEPQHLDFWMKDTEIELSIIFIGDDGIVISNTLGVPYSEDLISADYAQYVFECNPTDVAPGTPTSLAVQDEFPELEVNKLYIYDALGNIQGTLEGGERIFSRKSSRVIVRKAKKAFKTKEDADYKALGRYVFNEMDAQDERKPEYV